MSGRFTSAHQRDRTALFGNAQSTYGRNVSSSTTPLSGTESPGFRAATPNSKGQYSAQTYDDLESQNDGQLEGLFGQVRKLKEVTTNIGDHIKQDNKLLSGMEDQFSSATLKLKGTFNRMMIMAERCGVGWRAWLLVFGLIFLVFFYVWWR